MSRLFHSWLSCWGRFVIALSLAGLLAGCATTETVSARVTSFQNWPPGTAGQAYRIVPSGPAQQNNLEFQTFADMVRAGMGTTGLVEALPGKPARFDVYFQYGVSQTQVMVRRPYEPYMYGAWAPGFYGPGYWGGWGGYWGPEWVDTPMVANRNSLMVEIRDGAQGGAEVYRASAYNVSTDATLMSVMPYLVRAIFDNFPGNNGAEREVQYMVGR